MTEPRHVGPTSQTVSPGKKIGTVNHFYTDLNVAVIDIEDVIEVGDRVLFQGSSTNFSQTVKSMQVEHEDIERAEEGQAVGMKVANRVREGDEVFLAEDA